MENLHSGLDKLTIDGPQLKLDWSLRNQLIKKLNEHSGLGIRTNEPERMKAIEENNQMITALNSLPVLVEDDVQQSNLDRNALRLIREIDYVKHQLGEFDARKHNIVVWFKRFEGLSDMLGWSNEQRVDALPHLLGPALDRLACQVEPAKSLDTLHLAQESTYELIKNNTLDLVSKLLIPSVYTGVCDHLIGIIPIFEEKKFTDAEKRYWLSRIASPAYYKDFRSGLGSYGIQRTLSRLLERLFD